MILQQYGFDNEKGTDVVLCWNISFTDVKHCLQVGGTGRDESQDLMERLH